MDTHSVPGHDLGPYKTTFWALIWAILASTAITVLLRAFLS